MAVQTPYLQTDGDINQAKRKRAGEAVGIGDIAQSAYDPNPYMRNAQARDDAAQQRNAVNGLPAPTGPRPARAQQMREQSRIPVVRGTGVQDAYSSNPLLRGMQETADSNNQRHFKEQADRADRLRETVDRETSRALATAYDKGAAYNKAVSLTAPMADQYEAMRQSGELQAAIDGASRNRPIATPGPATPGIGSRAVDYAQGVGQLAAGVVSAPATTAIDLGRAGIAWLDGSELEKPNAARDVSGKLMYDGVNNIGQALDGSRGIVRDLIGAKPTQPSDGGSAAAAPVSPPKPTDKPGSTNKASAADQAAPVVAPNAPAAFEYTQTGTDGIVMRVGKNGVPEFTNDPAAVAGAQVMPAGGIGGRQAQQSAPGSMVAPAGSRVLASGSNTPDQEFARLGSAANLGDGIGTASFGNDGDSRLALERFERANQIRAQSIAENRGRELGDNGGRLTVVRDSTRTPTLQERQLARLDARLAETEARRAGAREAAATGADTRATNSLVRAKTQQDIASGELELQNAKTIQQLRALMADPSLKDADRQSAMQAYNALTISPKDRYILQDTVLASDPVTGPKYGKVALDVLTGRPVAGGIGEGLPGLPAGVSKEQALSQAKAAIAAGASKADVNRRLQGMGLDPL